MIIKFTKYKLLSFLLYNVYRLTMIFDSNSGSTLNQSLNLFVTCLKVLFISCNKYTVSFFKKLHP